MLIKLGKMKITADFKLSVDDFLYRTKQRALRWSLSPNMRVDITNEINLGCELYTCLTPDHPKFPAMKVNAKVEEIKLSVSRRVVHTILRIVGL